MHADNATVARRPEGAEGAAAKPAGKEGAVAAGPGRATHPVSKAPGL